MRRAWMLLFLVPALAAGGPPKPERDGSGPTTTSRKLVAMGRNGVAMGDRRLSAGQFILAASRFELELEANPAIPGAKRGLALARAGLKQCEAAVLLLHELRAAGEWDSDLAVAEGNCAQRHADVSVALAAFQEAVLLDPDDPDGWFGIAVAAIDLDDWGLYDEAIAGIDSTAWRARRADAMHAVADGEAWAKVGGDDAWEALSGLAATLHGRDRSAHGGRLEAWAIEGQLWLASGDPIAAEHAFGRGAAMSKRAPRVGALRAEALRRLGSPGEAAWMFEDGRARKGDHVTKQAILARVRVDQGDLAEARAILDDAPHSSTDVLASEWYYARAAGDAAAMTQWETRWNDSEPPGDERLDQLIPW